MNITTAIASYLQISEEQIKSCDVWEKVILVKFVKGKAKFVSKKEIFTVMEKTKNHSTLRAVEMICNQLVAANDAYKPSCSVDVTEAIEGITLKLYDSEEDYGSVFVTNSTINFDGLTEQGKETFQEIIVKAAKIANFLPW